MKILPIYPVFPNTIWSFKYALKFVGKKAAYPPMGLLTVASMLPAEFHKRLLDGHHFRRICELYNLRGGGRKYAHTIQA